jgi:hypothetical protein
MTTCNTITVAPLLTTAMAAAVATVTHCGYRGAGAATGVTAALKEEPSSSPLELTLV